MRAVPAPLPSPRALLPLQNYHQQYLSKGGRFNRPQSAQKGCTDKASATANAPGLPLRPCVPLA